MKVYVPFCVRELLLSCGTPVKFANSVIAFGCTPVIRKPLVRSSLNLIFHNFNKNAASTLCVFRVTLIGNNYFSNKYL
jgi:hypothetical protein